MAFPDSFISELVERNEISDVVSSYVKLTKRSGSNLFGLCPFHSEKTPSFSVAPDKQIYHCFGCGKGGGVINFIMETENLSFPDAVHFLAKRAGMQVPEDRPDENVKRRERMMELSREAARFFHGQLQTPQGAAAVAYLERRRIGRPVATRFGIGAAPDSWDSLTGTMLRTGFTKAELLDAGLARASKKGEGGIYDTFRNRLMFPIIDVRGSVIGFSGRILDDGEPKYMNSPETLIFNKSRNLFGLNLAKKSKKGYIILTEGNIDVVALHQAGMDCAVASLGTSLTAEQARLISNYVREVVIAYDADSAGTAAAQRAIGILEQIDLKVKVLRMSGAKDPDEYIQKFGAAAFENLISRSENHIEYRLTSLMAKYDLSNEENRIGFLKEAMDFIAALPNKVEREVYSLKVAELGKVSGDAVKNEVERLRKKSAVQAKKRYEREISRPARAVQPKPRSIRYANERSAAAEEGILRLLCLEPELFTADLIDDSEFSSPVLGKMFTELSLQVQKGGKTQIALLVEKLSADEISHLTQIIEKPLEHSNSKQALSDYIDTIRMENLANAAKTESSADELLEMARKLKESKGYGGKG